MLIKSRKRKDRRRVRNRKFSHKTHGRIRNSKWSYKNALRRITILTINLRSRKAKTQRRKSCWWTKAWKWKIWKESKLSMDHRLLLLLFYSKQMISSMWTQAHDTDWNICLKGIILKRLKTVDVGIKSITNAIRLRFTRQIMKHRDYNSVSSGWKSSWTVFRASQHKFEWYSEASRAATSAW